MKAVIKELKRTRLPWGDCSRDNDEPSSATNVNLTSMTQPPELRICPGCRLQFPFQPELTESNLVGFARYGVASPECLAVFESVHGKEAQYGAPCSFRLDAYAVQHPRRDDHQKQLGINKRFVAASIQSVAIHLIALYSIIEKQWPLDSVSQIMNHILTSGATFPDLQPPNHFGNLTILDVNNAQSRDEHISLISQWSHSAWNAWKKHHAFVKEWYNEYYESSKRL